MDIFDLVFVGISLFKSYGHHKADRFAIQTNELLARRLEPEYWTKFETVLLFVDSVEWLTDIHRDRGLQEGFRGC